MGFRSRVAGTLTRAAKALAGEPAAMAQAAAGVSQMGMEHPFAPGEPVRPYDGYSRHPRALDFATGYNIATRPRTHERVSFDTLRGLVESYDVAQICIHHRIDSLRSLDWNLTAAPWYTGDVTDAVATGMKALRKPDGVNSFETWFAKWMFDVLAYDAGCLYRLRNRAGRVVGLQPVDGTTIAPLLDYWGNPPAEPAEAYVQYVNGLPWNWLTCGDLIYEPFRPRTNSPYGHAPLESILLNANTDIRFQVYFLERFTEGNIPEAFASAPETWSPGQIEQWQGYWDSFMYGDQAAKHQIKWMPGGSAIAWSNEKDFTDAFSLFLMRKSCAAYHVVPTDIGFTENSNYSTGESQADVGHRVGDLPLGRYAERIITSWLQDDLGLPVKHQFDWGEEQDDRVAQAQADDIYIKIGAIGPSELRQMRFGLDEPEGRPVPRFIFTARAGPIPLSSLYDVAGPVDEATGAPEPGTELPHREFELVEGVVPVPPPKAPALAERLYGPQAVPPAPPPQPVTKDGEAAGITSETGVYGYDLAGHQGHAGSQDDEEDEGRQDDRAAAVKAELAAFRRYGRARRKAGTWRDFAFEHAGAVAAHRLNDAGRLAVRKAAGDVAVAGLAVRAADTGRVLMLQRALDDDDPASGTWEFPGGHIENGEDPLQAACREWQEETGCALPEALIDQGAAWRAPGSIYQGFVWPVESEDCVPVNGDRDQVTNPDDPDGDQVEAIAWWDPAQLPGNPAVRPELAAEMDLVLDTLGMTVAKAAAGPKAQPPDGGAQQGQQPPVQAAWPGWDLDLDAAAYWAPLLAAALAGALSARELAEAWLALGRRSDAATKAARIRELAAQAGTWLREHDPGLETAVEGVLRGILADGYAIGAASAHAAAEAAWAGSSVAGVAADMGGWTPGATSVARELAGNLGGGEGLRDLLSRADVTIRSVADSRLDDLGRVLAAGAERGASADEIGSGIQGVLSDPSRAQMIALTELNRAANSAAFWQYRLHGADTVIWVTAEDGGVCPLCDANEAAGPRPLGGEFPSGDETPPAHPRCVIGSTRVAVPGTRDVMTGDVTDRLPLDLAALTAVLGGDRRGPAAAAVTVARQDFGRGNIRAVSDREYVGDVITIRTACGYELTATPNHPVATRRGWVPVADLEVGDNVLCSTGGEWTAPSVNPDVDDIPPCIQDVAQSLSVQFGPVPTAAEDFHGDGAGSEVHVVRADGLLVDDIAASRTEHAREHDLGRRHVSAIRSLALDAERPRSQELGSLPDAPDGLMGCRSETGPLLRAGLGHAGVHGIAPAAELDSRLAEPHADGVPADAECPGKSLFAFPGEVAPDHGGTVDTYTLRARRSILAASGNTGLDEPLADALLADTEGFCDLLAAIATDVAPDDLVYVERHAYRGHVYNLDTVDGWYISNGIITHNCRCAIVPG